MLAYHVEITEALAFISAGIAMQEAGYYSRESYWDDRYANKNLCGSTEEWIFTFAVLKQLLPIQDCKKIVDVGCGISSLLSDIRTDGFPGQLFGVDFSKPGIEQAKVLHGSQDISYIHGDAQDLTKHVGTDVDLIIDKTAIDSILCAGAVGRSTVMQYCHDVGKALREDGSFVWCSFQSLSPYGQEILDGIIVPGLTSSNDYHGLGWTLDIHSWESHAENKDLNPTVYVFKKVHRTPRFLGDDVSAIDTSMHYY